MSKKIIVLDAETTGLDAKKDEILQLTILSDKGDVLFNEYIRPTKHESWPDAEQIHHISYAMVKDCEPLSTYVKTINRIIKSADVIVGYNHSFDLAFLEEAGIHSEPTKNYDLMLEFSQIKGDWDNEHNNYKWYKLKECADYYGYNWGKDSTHDSLADCKAILFCYHKIVSGEKSADGEVNHPSGFQSAIKRGEKSHLKLAISIALLISVILIGFITLSNMLIANRGKITTITASSLVKIINRADLSTMKYTYNSLAHADDDKGKIKYYVSYKGTIKAGIDLSKIGNGISIDSQAKTITIELPPVEIQETSVADSSLDFIFLQSKYDTDEAYIQGLKLCNEDLKDAANNDSLLSTAKENAKATIQAMLSPWIGQEYTIVFE